jgi:tartrate-resistant acid phosphatase type 5
MDPNMEHEKSGQPTGGMTRREALRKSVLFSTGLLTAGWLGRAEAREPISEFSSDGLHFLAVGDYGTGNETQRIVARQMANFSGKLGSPLTAVLALGDNFYGRLEPARFEPHFEQMYSKKDFDCPFYACLGNHDYGPHYDSRQGTAKAQMQLDYARNNPSSRWKMPAKWYSVELPNPENPLVKMIVLDGNYFEAALTPQEKLAQKRFLEAELQKQTKARWQWMVTHFPMFSQTASRGDNTGMIRLWGKYLQAHPFSLYISGHDHNLQHVRVADYRAEFVVSGAGGAHLYDVEGGRGFCKKILGFNHIHVSADKLTVQFIDAEGGRLYAFERDLNGKIKILT